MPFDEAIAPYVAGIGFFLVASALWRREATAARILLLAVSLLFTVRYFVWRILYTLPAPGLLIKSVFTYALLVVEIAVGILAARRLLVLKTTVDRASEADTHAGWFEANPPFIDVLIPSYNESAAILERTLVGATHQDYPRYRVWLLDDGNRPWLRELARTFGVEYITRPSNEHGKAGNLNHALRTTLAATPRAEFVAVLDADFVAKPRFLRRTLALMHRPTVGVVQTPQFFFNADPFQHAVRSRKVWPDEQRYFYGFRLLSMDSEGSATCCGTSFLARVSSVEAIGGFPTESVSEDTLTSIKLNRLGIRTVYLDEQLSSGLAPEGLSEFLTQRHRWCLGGIQIAKSAWGPLARGWSLKNLLLFLEAALRWGLPSGLRWFWFVMPILYWFTGFYVLRAPLAEVIYYVAPLAVERVTMAWLSRGTILPIVSDAMSVVAGRAVIAATLQGLSGRETKFRVTDKGKSRHAITLHWDPLLLLGGMLLLTIIGAAYGTWVVHISDTYRYWNYYWSGYSVLVLSAAIAPCIELPNRRAEQRFETSERTFLHWHEQRQECRAIDLSLDGARIRRDPLTCQANVGASVLLELENVGALAGQVTRAVGAELGVTFSVTPEQRIAMIRKLYCADEYVRVPSSWSWYRCMLALGRRALEPMGSRNLAPLSQMPAAVALKSRRPLVETRPKRSADGTESWPLH